MPVSYRQQHEPSSTMAEQQTREKQSVWTILEMIRWGTQYFTEKEIDSPRLTMELILCAATGLERVGLYTNFEKPLSAAELDVIRTAVRRRSRHEPLQYIIGTTSFYGLKLMVSPSVLIPRPETELLVEHAINRAKKRPEGISILDIGTGSGCIALALSGRIPGARVTAIDVSAEALGMAAANASSLADERIIFEQCDIIRDVPSGAPFDMIVSNPPYIPSGEIGELQAEVREHEPVQALAGGEDGLLFYRRFAEIFPAILKPGGEYCVEIGYGQHEAIRDLLSGAGMTAEMFRDYSGIARCVHGMVTF